MSRYKSQIWDILRRAVQFKGLRPGGISQVGEIPHPKKKKAVQG